MAKLLSKPIGANDFYEDKPYVLMGLKWRSYGKHSKNEFQTLLCLTLQSMFIYV